jgi:dTMP kinase
MFVTVDGPNGSGKTTLIRAVCDQLTPECPVYTTTQPSQTPLGQMIRGGERAYHGRALACLVAGDRHHQLQTEILPRLAEGAIVLCDRYIESSLVFQRLDGVDVDEILTINQGIVRPDLRIRLLVNRGILRRRLASRELGLSQRFEAAPDAAARELAFYQEADRVLTRAYGLPATVYDTGAMPPATLAEQVAQGIRVHMATARRVREL